MGKDVIIACDFKNGEDLIGFLECFKGEKPFVKVGMELFYSEGPSILQTLKKRGHKVFLDVKVHDIPNTAKRTMAVLSKYGIDMVNVHAAGTSAMMKAALSGLNESESKRPILIAVTQLTSTDQRALKEELLITSPMDDVVTSYAINAKESGLDGVVCSALEAKEVHGRCGDDFITVTPGIRFPEDESGDQKRVMSPSDARMKGADYIVVGRSITGADNPLEAYRRCCRDFIQDR